MQETDSAPVETAPARIGVWARIREHKVLQWGIAYLGAGLAVAQGAELLADAFGWPELVIRIVMVALVIGLPIALTIAWYHGHRGAQQMSQGELAIVSVLLLIGAVFFTVTIRPPSGNSAEPAAASAPVESDTRAEDASPPPNSIAVLPFANLSSDTEQEYFADGLSEELLNQLSKIEQLLVTARTSSFAYKGRTGDIATIGRELGVRHVLEGSVRKAGNQVRITAQLIDTTTGFHLWSETYNGELADVFALQDQISRSVADALQITLGIGREEFRAGGTENTVAYEHYLLARSLQRQRGQPERVLTELEQALALDAEFGLAQIELANVLGGLATNTVGRDDLASRRDLAIERAEAIAPDLPETYWLRAQRDMRQREWIAADRAVQEMWARSSPNDYAANVAHGSFLRQVGYVREALPYATRAKLLDPLVSGPYVTLGIVYDALGDYERSVATYEEMRANVAALVGNDIRPHLFRVLARGDIAAARKVIEDNCDAQFFGNGQLPACPADGIDNGAYGLLLGDADRARAELRAGYATRPNDSALAMAALGLFAARIDADLSTEAFGKALLQDPAWLVFAWTSTMEPVRRHPDFKEIVTEMGLVDYWRAKARWPERCRPLGERDFECF